MIAVKMPVTVTEEVEIPIDFIMYKRDSNNRKVAMVVGVVDPHTNQSFVGWSTPDESRNRHGAFDRAKALNIALGRMRQADESLVDVLNPANNTMILRDLMVSNQVRGMVSRGVNRLRRIQDSRYCRENDTQTKAGSN